MAQTIAKLSYRAAVGQIALWRSKLPWIQPHYAVKCNNLPQLLTWYKEHDISFDCASPGEIDSVLKLGAHPERIIYANPCKSSNDVEYAQKQGIPRTVVDSVEEVEKLANCKWKGDILVRLAVPDKDSRHPFSSKFGATERIYPQIFQAICEKGLTFKGFSFHVGSECMNPKQYYNALKTVAHAKRVADSFSLQTSVIDVGGGFMWDTESFSDAANEIEIGRKEYFAYSDYEWISEPGRFFAQPVLSLYIPIIAMRRMNGIQTYTLNESIYGMFSCIPFDGQKPIFLSDTKGDLEQCTLFGRTCDSADVLGYAQLPKQDCGNVLQVQNMGAYTNVSSSQFNGFELPLIECVE